MLPFDRKPWAKKVAHLVIAGAILGIAITWIYLRTLGPLDLGEYLAFFLFALTVIPPNVAIIRQKPRSEEMPPLGDALHHRL